jgi:hypothetical protein
MTNAKDLIMGTSSPAMAFTYPNDGVTGQIITEPKAAQQTVYDPRNPQSKELAFWPSGDPKMQVIFQIQTAFRNHEGIKNPDRSSPDNGVRTIYLKGKHMERATAEAVRAVGADWLEVGGTVWYRYTGDDMTSLAGVKPKLFEVRYQPPAPKPPAHFNQQAQQGYQGAQQGYPPQGHQDQGYPAQRGPQPPTNTYTGQGPAPAWQQAGWTASPTVPSHHGQEQAMPDWARPASSPPAQAAPPSSAPPAPALSTLDMIRQGQSGSPDYGTVEPAF